MIKGLQRILRIAGIDKAAHGDIGGETLSKMINLTNAAGCAGPELLRLQNGSQHHLK
jgi:hypothetical protein